MPVCHSKGSEDLHLSTFCAERTSVKNRVAPTALQVFAFGSQGSRAGLTSAAPPALVRDVDHSRFWLTGDPKGGGKPAQSKLTDY